MTEKFGPDDAAERERQAYNAEPAPPLVDTADLGHAERLAKLRDRAEAIIKADPVPTFGKAREEIATTIDGTLMTTAKADDSRCDAIAPNSTARCCYRADHPPLIVQGAQYDHHVPGVVSWNVPYIEAPAPFARCDATIKNGFDETVRCGLPAGHSLNRGSDDPGVGGHYDHTGQTAAGKLLWWRDMAADAVPSTFPAGGPAATPSDPVNDASSWIGKVFGGAGGPALKLTALNPQPVRVRFVDLPHRHTEGRGPFGNPLHIAEPGGFALVVDRFRTIAHMEAEREMWTAWADLIGARTVLCYPGELDIVDYLSE